VGSSIKPIIVDSRHRGIGQETQSKKSLRRGIINVNVLGVPDGPHSFPIIETAGEAATTKEKTTRVTTTKKPPIGRAVPQGIKEKNEQTTSAAGPEETTAKKIPRALSKIDHSTGYTKSSPSLFKKLFRTIYPTLPVTPEAQGARRKTKIID